MSITPATRQKVLEMTVGLMKEAKPEEIVAAAEQFLTFIDVPAPEAAPSTVEAITDIGWLEASRVYAVQMGQNIDTMTAEMQDRMKWLTRQVVLAALKPRVR